MASHLEQRSVSSVWSTGLAGAPSFISGSSPPFHPCSEIQPHGCSFSFLNIPRMSVVYVRSNSVASKHSGFAHDSRVWRFGLGSARWCFCSSQHWWAHSRIGGESVAWLEVSGPAEAQGTLVRPGQTPFTPRSFVCSFFTAWWTQDPKRKKVKTLKPPKAWP